MGAFGTLPPSNQIVREEQQRNPVVRDTVMVLEKGAFVLRRSFPDSHQGQIDETDQDVSHIEARKDRNRQ